MRILRRFSTKIRRQQKENKRKEWKREDTVSLAEESDTSSLVEQPPLIVEAEFLSQQQQPHIRVANLGCGWTDPQDSVSLIKTADDLPERTAEAEDRSTSTITGSFDDDDALITEAAVKPDMYGQVHPTESPKLIKDKLVVFDRAVAKLPPNKKHGLIQAMTKCPELLDNDFKLQFLRCETFDVPRAAKRYAKYWDKRLEVFGPVKAFQPLTLAGALSEDAEALSVGYLTLAPTKDPMGRTIIFADPAKQDRSAYTSLSMARAIWYMFHAALEEESTQQKGVVFIADLRIVSFALLDAELVRVVATSVTGCLPVRISAIHGCCPPPIFSAIFPVIKILLGERLRKRVRIFGGSLPKVQKDLTKYGLTQDILPDQLGGEAVIDHQAWLAERKEANM